MTLIVSKHERKKLRVLLFSLVVSTIFLPIQTNAQPISTHENFQTIRRLDLKEITSLTGTHTVKLQRKDTPQVLTLNQNAGIINLRPGDYIFARSRKTAELIQSSSDKMKFLLPWDIYGIAANGLTLNLKLIAEIAGGGFRADTSVRLFVTSLALGVLDKDRQAESISLNPPVRMHITANVDNVDPGDIIIQNTNLPLTQVTLKALDPSDPVKVTILPSFDPQPFILDVNVIRPSLMLNVSPESIQGLGLEKAKITIKVRGLANPSDTLVTLDADRGGLEETSLKLDDNGTASSSIRSVGTGVALIRAETSWRTEPVEAKLTFEWPWKFLIAVLIGSSIGAIIKRRKLKMAFACGFGLAILYAIGINISEYTPEARVGEALMTGVALLGAIGGPTVYNLYEKIYKK